MSALKDTDCNREHDITIEEVRACAMFAHLTDAEAEEVIATIKQFSSIIYHYYQRQKDKKTLL